MPSHKRTAMRREKPQDEDVRSVPALNTILAVYAAHQTYGLAAVGVIIAIALIVIGPFIIKR